jgi:hypothetical protein
VTGTDCTGRTNDFRLRSACTRQIILWCTQSK